MGERERGVSFSVELVIVHSNFKPNVDSGVRNNHRGRDQGLGFRLGTCQKLSSSVILERTEARSARTGFCYNVNTLT